MALLLSVSSRQAFWRLSAAPPHLRDARSPPVRVTRGLQSLGSAVDSLDVDWFAEAAESAQSYIDMMGFSHSGLVEQLMFEGFTADEAEHGVTAVGL